MTRRTATPAAGPRLAPFLRRGQPVPLTISDYAHRADVPRPVAVDELVNLCRAGLVAIETAHGGTPSIYGLTTAGMSAAMARVPA